MILEQVKRRAPRRLTKPDSIRLIQNIKAMVAGKRFPVAAMAEIMGCSRRTARRWFNASPGEIPGIGGRYAQSAAVYTGLSVCRLTADEARNDTLTEAIRSLSSRDALELYKTAGIMALHMASFCHAYTGCFVDYTVSHARDHSPMRIDLSLSSPDGKQFLIQTEKISTHGWIIKLLHGTHGVVFQAALSRANFNKINDHILRKIS